MVWTKTSEARHSPGTQGDNELAVGALPGRGAQEQTGAQAGQGGQAGSLPSASGDWALCAQLRGRAVRNIGRTSRTSTGMRCVCLDHHHTL